MPSHGMTITRITHIVLAPPPRSLLRKMSPRTQNKHMNHAKNRKNSKRASKNEPLSSNIWRPFTELKWWIHLVDGSSSGHRKKASPVSDELSSHAPASEVPRTGQRSLNPASPPMRGLAAQ